MKHAPKPEFSRPFRPERLGAEPHTISLEARPAERDALARRFGLLSLDSLTARLTLSWPRGRRVIEARGRLRAEVVQPCGVTLAPVASVVDEAFLQRYTLEDTRSEDEPIELDPEGEDPPEPVGPEGLDLGEAVAQELGLALDPYPRAPGADLAAEAPGLGSGGDAAPNPFAVLKALKRSDPG